MVRRWGSLLPVVVALWSCVAPPSSSPDSTAPDAPAESAAAEVFDATDAPSETDDGVFVLSPDSKRAMDTAEDRTSLADAAPPDAPPEVTVADTPPARGERFPLAASGCGRWFCGAPGPGTMTAVALGDIDGDGWIDAIVAEAGPALGALGALTVLRNDAGEALEDVTARAGLAGLGAYAMILGDLDRDGDPDLVLGGRRRDAPPGERAALRVHDNDGTGRFTERVLGQLPEGGEGVPLSVRLADLDLDGLTDVVAGYGGTDPRRSYFDRVLLARPDGRWSAPAEPLDDPGFTWLALPTDLDHDGRQDLLVANDAAATIDATSLEGRVPCPLPRLLPPESYRHVGAWLSTQRRSSINARGDLSLALWDELDGFTGLTYTPMGLVASDLDGDGLDDYLGTNSGVLWYCVSRPSGGCRRRVEDVFDLRVREGAPPVSWSPRALDLDRDGDQDLVITFGGVTISRAQRGNAVLLNTGSGHFVEAPSGHGLDPVGWWSALAAADLDRDGDEDVLLGAQALYRPLCAGPPERGLLLRNELPREGRHALLLKLRGAVSNTDALGAVVRVRAGERTLVRTVSQGGATQSADTPELVIGIGALPGAEVTVRWPGGFTQDLGYLPADRLLVREEPRWAVVEPERPAAGTMVTVRVLPAMVSPGPSLLRMELAPGVRWAEAPALVGGELRGRFLAPPRGETAVVSLAVPGEGPRHTFRVWSR
ncbi:MAG: CRTAC1 family protein [Deltaproteobacteria bacterium]|nr:CRTAC1 family protein [Deltaproteobacteria bacterium]